jgi:hypothetical protein
MQESGKKKGLSRAGSRPITVRVPVDILNAINSRVSESKHGKTRNDLINEALEAKFGNSLRIEQADSCVGNYSPSNK